MTLQKELNNDGICYDICLVSMPYVSLTLPSLALGLLKSILTKSGLKVKVIEANVLFAEKIGLEKYNLLTHSLPMQLMAGEWSFSTSAFPDINRDDSAYLDACIGMALGSRDKEDFNFRENKLRNDLLYIRSEAKLFIHEITEKVLETGAKIVGCTSTFEQHVASLALLKNLKSEAPHIVSMMGGANCEGDMGLATHRNFDWVDYVVSGEADEIIVDLCKNALSMGVNIPPSMLPDGVLGPLHRKSDKTPSVERIKFNKLDELPVPDYSDYFDLLKNSWLSKHIQPGLPLETSRGCWWGAIHHCTFCGLNGNGMGFRSKSSENVIHEIETLEDRHDISDFEVVDNILEMSYFKTLLPELAIQPKSRNLFYEVKANLGRDKILALKQAGVNWIQPGIESLHTKVLDLMDKGVKGWQNIQLLKWCRELGVRLSWSVLYDFPGEKREWYNEMLDWIPLLEHLQAPSGFIPVRFDRFSVYHTKAKEIGLDLLPFSALYHVYDLPLEEINDLAYFFVNRGAYDPFGVAGPNQFKDSNRASYDELNSKLKIWRGQFWKGISPILSMEEREDSLVIIDSRSCSKVFRNVLTGLNRGIMLACDKAPTQSKLFKVLSDDEKLSFSKDEYDNALLSLKEWGYILEIDNRCINLAVKGNIPSLSKRDKFPGGNIINLEEAKKNGRVSVSRNKSGLISKDKTVKFETPFMLDSGRELPEVSVNYQCYGELNEDHSNAILVFHTFTKNAHLAGKFNENDEESGWWDKFVGPGKPLDTSKYFVICSNALGGCGGSTGPSSINPLTDAPYAMSFPVITVGDMVNLQKRLMDHLNIPKWGAIVGGCFGGDQALEWLARYPKLVGSAIVLSVTASTSTHTVALSTAMRNMICNDPKWNDGNYYGKEYPVDGLTNSLLAAFPIWMSREAMHHRFGRKRLIDDKKRFTFETDFAVEHAMLEMCEKAQKDFDPNSMIYMSKAVEYFDLPYYYGSLEAAFDKVTCPVLFISYKSDWRYPPEEVDQLHQAMLKIGVESRHLKLDHPFGHSAFVYDPSALNTPVINFLKNALPAINTQKTELVNS